MGANKTGIIRITAGKGTVAKELAIMTVMGALIILGVAVPVISYAAFLFCAAVIVVSDLQTGFCYMFFLMPFATVFKFSVGSSSNFTYLQILIVAKTIYAYFSSISRNFLIAVLLFAVYVILGSKMDVLTAIKQIMIPMTIYCFFKAYKADTKVLLRFFVYGLLLSSTISLFIDSIPNLDKYVVLEKAVDLEEDVTRANGLYSDPNYYSLALLMAISGLLSLFAVRKTGVLGFVCAVLLVVFGTRTVSKSFLLALAVVTVLFVINLYALKRTRMAIVLTVVSALLFAAVLSGKIGIFNNILSRFEVGGNDVEELTTGRSDIWKVYMDSILENPLRTLFGYGIGAGYPRGTAAHNTLLDFLYYYGIVGSVLFITTCAIACKPSVKRRFSLMNLYAWLVFLTLSMALSCLKFFDFGYIITFSILIFRTAFYVKETTDVRNAHEQDCQDITEKIYTNAY